MPKLIYNPFTNSFDYINKPEDFAISSLKDVQYLEPEEGDSLVWNNTLGKWSSQNVTGSPNLDGGHPDTNYTSTPTVDGGVP